MLQLQIQQETSSLFHIQNVSFELDPTNPNADNQLSDLSIKAFASAFGIDTTQSSEVIKAQMAQMLQGGLNDKNGKPIFSLMQYLRQLWASNSL
jgi:hypothetical protein